jgi:hypothetical protein
MGATTAAAAVGGAAGVRAWLATKRRSWMTPRRMRIATIALLAASLLASSLALSGT